MSQPVQRIDIAKKTVVYQIPGMEDVSLRRDIVYRTTAAGDLTLDLYSPPKTTEPMPAVIFVLGYSDVGAQSRLGCKFKEMGSYISWAKLSAASGMVAITYTNREPITDLGALLQFIRENASSLGIDSGRVGIWAASGNVPLALSLLMETEKPREYPRCAVLCYGLMLDLDGATGVAEAAKTWGFVNPCIRNSVSDLAAHVPLFIARAGRDQTPHLNQALDAFVAKALERNLPITLANHPTGPHAFDVFDDSDTSCSVIRQILEFMRSQLIAKDDR
jgi:hypothetical protein